MGRQARGKCQETLIVLTVSTYDANFPQSIPSPIGCAESKTIYCKLIHPKSTTLNGQIAETDHREKQFAEFVFFLLAIYQECTEFCSEKNGCNGFYKFLCCLFYLQK